MTCRVETVWRESPLGRVRPWLIGCARRSPRPILVSPARLHHDRFRPNRCQNGPGMLDGPHRDRGRNRLRFADRSLRFFTHPQHPRSRVAWSHGSCLWEKVEGVAGRIGVTTTDLRQLLDVVDPARAGESGDLVPYSLLHDVADL